jgi:hypothetical protein
MLGNFGGLCQTSKFILHLKLYGCLKFVDSVRHFSATKMAHHYSELVITKKDTLEKADEIKKAFLLILQVLHLRHSKEVHYLVHYTNVSFNKMLQIIAVLVY